MFKRSNFCHVASNNRNNVKSGVFIYRTTDNLATVSANGYFNDMIIDINLHDLIIHEQIDASDSTKVERNLLAVSAKSLDNINTVVVQSKWEKDIGEQLDGFVKIDGTSVMTAPLKFLAGSMRGAVGPYLNGVSFWKMDSQGNITNIANLTDSQFLPTTTNAIDIGRSGNKWKDLYLGGKAYVGAINNGADITVPTSSGTMALTSDIKDSTITISLNGVTQDSFTLNQDSAKTIDIAAANTDLSNLTSKGKNIAYWASTVSNCIAEIPQDINLTLSNGTLTLKAGSKFYLPNGVNVFDVYTSSNDHSATNSNNGVHVVFTDSVGHLDAGYPLNRIGSGATLPANNNDYSVFYNTTDGKMYTWQTDQFKVRLMSLPIAIVTISGGAITNIDRIFNGIGYVGHHTFLTPGVTGLIPDGFNDDGTLKNITCTISSVRIQEMATNQTSAGTYRTLNLADVNTAYSGSYTEVDNYEDMNTSISLPTYVRSLNKTFNPSTGAQEKLTPIVTFLYTTANGVEKFDVKSTFRVVDYNDYTQTQSQVSTNTANIATNASDIAAIIANTKSITAKDTLNSVVTTTGITKSQNGYVKLGNGIIIQWGTTSDNVTNQDYTINFPTAFSSTNYSFAGACIGQQNEDALCIITQNTANIVVQARSLNAGSVNKPYSWIAIGY